MKALSLVFIFLLSLSITSAADISFTLNEGSEPILLDPSGSLIIDSTIAANVYVHSVKVDTKNEILRQMIEDELSRFEHIDRSDQPIDNREEIILPDTLPKGTHVLSVQVSYSDANYVDQIFEEDITVEISGDFVGGLVNFLTKLLPDDAASELVDLLTNRQLEPIDRKPTREELRQLFDKDEGNIQVVEIDTQEETQEINEELISSYLDLGNEELTKDAKRILKQTQPNITKELHVYNITDLDTGESRIVSKIVISISYVESLNGVRVVEDIPKEVAANVVNLAFVEKPIVIEEDPIVKWNVDHVPKNQKKEYSYSVEGQLDSIESTTIAGGKEPSGFAKWIANLLAKWIG